MKTKEGLLVLRSGELDRAATDSEAYDRARPLMDQVNGALALSHLAGAVRLESIAEVFADGSCRLHQFVQLRATEARDRASMVVVVDGAEPAPPAPSIPQRRLAIAAEDDLLADALTYFGRGDDWFDTYKALECLELKFGGERKGQVERFRRLGWVDPDKIELLRWTANSGRHARKKFDPPPDPMERTEAREVLCVKFCKGGHGWLESCGLAELNFLVLFEIVHIEVAVGFEPVLVGLDG